MNIECVSILNSKENLDECQTFFILDFAEKLLQVYKHNKFVLKNVEGLIYHYFYREFPLMKVSVYSDKKIKKIKTVHSKLVKLICSQIFNEAGETFNQDLLGGGEFPFIVIYKINDYYFYKIEQ